MARSTHEERQQRKVRIFASALLIGLMVLSTVGYAFYYFNGDATVIRYNGHKVDIVVNDQQQILGYTSSVSGKQIQFYTPPTDSEQITLPPGFIDTIKQAQILVFVFDPDDNQTPLYDAVRFDLRTAIPMQQTGGVTNESDAYPFPLVSCENATAQYPFILLTHGNGSISYDNGCYVVAGDQTSFARLRDRIVYAYYGIQNS